MKIVCKLPLHLLEVHYLRDDVTSEVFLGINNSLEDEKHEYYKIQSSELKPHLKESNCFERDVVVALSLLELKTCHSIVHFLLAANTK